MWNEKLLTSIAGHRRRLACGVILCLLAASSSGAQELTLAGVQLDSGLMTFFTGNDRSVSVTVTEVGPLTAESHVKIVYRDASDRILLSDEAVLKRGQPVQLELPLLMAERRVQVRATITIFGQLGTVRSPIVRVEGIDGGALTVQPHGDCSAPAGLDGPVLPNCPPFSATRFVNGAP